ncbi:tryptophan synthase subunit alpha [Bacteroidales bacterium]|nr:tryptophan synthase subunit alpha [Bacteroidales bacterium]
MNRINTLVQDKDKKALSIYFTAGYPELNDTVTIIKTLEKSGVDLIEIGMPFSDPVADGPVIQHSSEVALKNGMSVQVLFDQLKDIRKEVRIPLILMGYFNPVLQYGIEDFCKKCQEVGVDGLIVPDLPPEVYHAQYREIFERYGLINIFLVTPQTPDSRMHDIDRWSDGFIYMVSSASTTGAKSSIKSDQEAYFKRMNNLGLKTPRIIGFGISNKETFDKACKYSNGAIIGSAFVKALQSHGSLKESITSFIKTIRK